MSDLHYKKYLKYKNKYLRAKNKIEQHGGNTPNTITLTRGQMNDVLSEYTQISNKGQHNCGVYVKNNDDTKILICNINTVNHQSFTDQLNILQKVNKQYKVFPDIYKIYIVEQDNNNSSSGYNTYVEYEKMEGDLTDLITITIPKKIINNSNLDETKKREMFDILKIKLSTKKFFAYNVITKKITSSDNKINDFINKINLFTIEYDEFDAIMKQIIREVEKTLENVVHSLANKYLALFKISYSYNDMKCDNFVYKTNNDGSYEMFIIDPESGLVALDDNDYENNKKNLVQMVNNKFDVLKLYGESLYKFLTSCFSGKAEGFDLYSVGVYSNVYFPITEYFLMEQGINKNIAKILLESYTLNKDNVCPMLNSFESLETFAINK